MTISALSQAVESWLIQALAVSAIDAGVEPTGPGARAQMPNQLAARLRLLPAVLTSSRFVLDETRPACLTLARGIRLRNQLVHHSGHVFIGPLSQLSPHEQDGTLTISIQVPNDPWGEVDMATAREIARQAEAYLEELNRVVSDEVANDLNFLYRSEDPGNER